MDWQAHDSRPGSIDFFDEEGGPTLNPIGAGNPVPFFRIGIFLYLFLAY